MSRFLVKSVRALLGTFRAIGLFPDGPWGRPADRNSLASEAFPIAFSPLASAHRLNIQSYQRALGPGEVPNNLLDWRRQPAHQGWNGDDLIASCQLRFLE